GPLLRGAHRRRSPDRVCGTGHRTRGDRDDHRRGPGRRREGNGSQMLTALLDKARRNEAESVCLEVRAQDDGAQRLYRRFGFVPLGIRPGYYQPEGADALVMQLPLTPPRRGPGPVGAEVIEE